MEVIALVVSALSLAVALVGTVLSNRRSSEALAESRKAATVALWSGAQEAVQRLIGSDPASEPVGERLKALDPYQRWAQVLGMNLRQFGAVGYDEAAASKLREHAADEMKRVCEANGWPLPPTTIPGLRALDSE